MMDVFSGVLSGKYIILKISAGKLTETRLCFRRACNGTL